MGVVAFSIIVCACVCPILVTVKDIQEMKAIRKGDGKEVDVILLHDKEYIDVLPNEHDCKLIYPAESLVVDEVVDWQAFRREAAKDILASISKMFISIEDAYLQEGVALSVKLADELIKQLQMGKE